MNKFKIFYICGTTVTGEVVSTNYVIKVDFKALNDAFKKGKHDLMVEKKLGKDLIKTGLVSKEFNILDTPIEVNTEGNFRSPRENSGKCIYIYANNENKRFELEEIDE